MGLSEIKTNMCNVLREASLLKTVGTTRSSDFHNQYPSSSPLIIIPGLTVLPFSGEYAGPIGFHPGWSYAGPIGFHPGWDPVKNQLGFLPQFWIFFVGGCR